MAYLRDNRKLLACFGAFVGVLVVLRVLDTEFGLTSVAGNLLAFATISGCIVWPWLLYKPSTLRTRVRRQFPVVAYLVAFSPIAVFASEIVSMVYTGAGFVWLIIYLVRNASGDRTFDDPYKDSRGLYGSVAPEPIFREH